MLGSILAVRRKHPLSTTWTGINLIGVLVLSHLVTVFAFPLHHGMLPRAVSLHSDAALDDSLRLGSRSNYLDARHNAVQCTSLTLDQAKTLPGWDKLTKIADQRWGTGSRKITTFDSHEAQYTPASACVSTQRPKATYTGPPSCQTNNVAVNGALDGTSGILSVAVAQGFTATVQMSLSKSASIGTEGLYQVFIDFPEIASTIEAMTISTEVTNSVTKSVTGEHSSTSTVTLLMNSPENNACKAQTSTQTCNREATGEMTLVAQGYIGFEYNDATADKNNTAGGKHYKWFLKLEDELTEEERSSTATFSGSIQAKSEGKYNGTCTLQK